MRHKPKPSKLVRICTDRRGDFQALADACWMKGWRSIWQIPGQPPQFHGANCLILDGWDCWPMPERGVPTILLLDFPRHEDHARAAGLGISRVLARPLVVSDLLAELGKLVGRTSAAIGAA